MQIGRVAIVGGTHGNEFTGVYLIKKWQKHPELLKKNHFSNPDFARQPASISGWAQIY